MENIKKLLKTDKSGLVSGFCSIPWTTILVNENGFLYACNCEGNVKKPICNILEVKTKQEFNSILNNNIFKNSILDASYRLCNSNNCSILQDNILLNKKIDIFKESLDELNKLTLKEIYLQVDESCNLQCPTCRSKIIIHKNNEKTKKLKLILEKLELFVFKKSNKIIHIRLVGNGELFASNIMLEWFLNFNYEKYPNIRFDIHTNATLLSRYETFLLQIANKLRRIEVSTDAANSNTYSLVRKNGIWLDLLKGYETIQKLRLKNKNIELSSSFVVSSLNYKDIPDFINFAKNQNANIVFYKVARWNMSNEKFENLNIFSPKHTEHTQFLQTIKLIDLNDSKILSNIFNIKLN